MEYRQISSTGTSVSKLSSAFEVHYELHYQLLSRLLINKQYAHSETHTCGRPK